MPAGAAELEGLRREAAGCTRCPLFEIGTRTVFGEGPATASVVLVGEQPGDQEDLAGRPFVGPAGKVLDRAFGEAGLDRAETYLTNAVKHFKHERRGKRRLHKRPNAYEIDRCKWWLDREMAAIDPRVVVALGVSAASALLDRPVVLARLRGTEIALPTGIPLVVTIHPSAILRVREEEPRHAAFSGLVDDLRHAVALSSRVSAPAG